MKRTREHVLENESRLALENFLPPEWIFRKREPRSDDEELKERTLKALLYSLSEMHAAAITELETALRVCVLSPTEKMSVLLNLGNAYY